MIFQAAWDKRKQYKRADRYFWTKFQAAIPIKVYGFESRLKLEKFIFQASIPQYKLLEVLKLKPRLHEQFLCDNYLLVQMNKIYQFLYDNYICWKTGVLVFMW